MDEHDLRGFGRLPRLWRCGVLTLLLVGAPGLLRCARAEDEGDFEYWAKASFVVPINDAWRFTFDQKLSFEQEGRRLENHQSDFRFDYSGLADWLVVGIGYKQKFEKDGGGWLKERRPLVNLTASTTLRGFGLSNRSRFEYRDEDEEETVWRYRNKVTVRSTATFTPLKIQPYAAEEIFVQLDDEDFNKHRIYGGFFIGLHERVRLELFYIWELDEEPGGWHDINILGSYVRFTF